MRNKLMALFDEWGLSQYIPFQTERAMLADFLLENGMMFEEDAFVQMRSAVEKIEEKLKDKLNKIDHPIAQATMALVIKDVLIPAIDEVREDEEQKLKGGVEE